jgi:hypothetical protein
MERYAAARIPWYLLAEPGKTDLRAVSLRLLRLDGTHYRTHAFAGPDEVLTSDEPFPISIHARKLIRPSA